MFFLVRSALWLGLVFTAMEWPGDGAPRSDLGPVSKPVAETLAIRSAEAVARGAEKICFASIRECIEFTARLDQLAGDEIRRAHKEPPHTGSIRQTAPATDTLSPADRQPAWQGSRSGKSAGQHRERQGSAEH